MKKICVLIFLMIMIISSNAGENRITQFLPDSLTTWQVKYMVNGSSETYDQDDQDQQMTNDTLDAEEINSNVKCDFSIAQQIDYHYRLIRPKRELMYNLMARYGYTRNSHNTAIRQTNNLVPYNISKNNTVEVTNYPYVSSNLSYDEYLAGKLGVTTRGNLSVYQDRTNNVVTDKNWDPDNDYQYEIQKRDEEIKSVGFSYSISTGVFYGRIYSGTYAAKAMEIIDQLRKKGMLKNELTDAEFNRLAAIILKHMTSYHYDTRIKTIEALSEIYDYLVEIDVLESQVSMPYAIVQDIYLNSPFTASRNFGTRFYVHISYQENHGQLISDNYQTSQQYRFHFDEFYEAVNDSVIYETEMTIESENQVKTWRPGVEIGIDYSSILNWHLWYMTRFAVNYRPYSTKNIISTKLSYQGEETESESTYRYENHDLQLRFQSQINYQMTSRSYLHLAALTYYTMSSLNQKQMEYEKYERITDDLDILIQSGFQYFITPKVSFELSGSANYTHHFYKRDYALDGSPNYYQNKDNIEKITSSLNFGFQWYL